MSNQEKKKNQNHPDQGKSLRGALIRKYAAAVGQKEYDLIHEFDNLLYELQYHAKMEGIDQLVRSSKNTYHHEYNDRYEQEEG